MHFQFRLFPYFRQDPEELDDEELKQIQGLGAVLAGEARCNLDGFKIGDAGAKVRCGWKL